MAATAGKLANVKVSGTAVSFTDEATTTTDDQTYKITDTTKIPWHRTAAITVEVGGSPVTTGFTINRLTGEVVFDTVATRTVTVTGSSLPMADVAQAYEYTLTIEADNQEATPFKQEFINRVQGMKDVSASISRYFVVDDVFLDQVTAGADCVLEFYLDYTDDAFCRVWALIASDEVSAAADGVVEDAIDFEGLTDANGRSVAIIIGGETL